MPTTTFWMSFSDPTRPEGQQFLGVVLVDAESLSEAITWAWLTGCNPGGEIRTVEVRHDRLPADKREVFLKAPRDALLDRDTLKKLGLMDD